MSGEVVAITGIAAGGAGVGRLRDGRAVFVPRTTPGERVRLRDEIELHKNFAKGEVEEIVAAGAARVTPPCPHYVRDRCGGCQLQHLAYEAQLAAKRAIVGDALRRIGKLDLPDPEIVEAIGEWRYRAKISLAVRRPGGPAVGAMIGLHPYDRPGAVFALADCHIADFQGGGGAPWLEAERLRAALPEPERVVCWWRPLEGVARVVAGPATGFPATAFEQVNPEMATLARRWAVEQLGDVRGSVAWDLYGGIGDTALLLAERGAQVVSVDADERAIEWARRRASGRPIRFIAGRVEEVLPSLPEPSVVVVNPPRAGLHWYVTLRLTGRPVGRLVYLSRDAATLARDLRRLSVNYRSTVLRAFDLFPQTAHVETVAVLEAA